MGRLPIGVGGKDSPGLAEPNRRTDSSVNCQSMTEHSGSDCGMPVRLPKHPVGRSLIGEGEASGSESNVNLHMVSGLVLELIVLGT